MLSVTWWRLFWVSPDEGYFECHLMKVILSEPDEGYFEWTWWRLFWVNLMKVILSVTWWRLFWVSPDEGYFEWTWWRLFWVSPDEGYFECHLMKVILSVTWWRFIQKRVVCTKFDIYVFIRSLVRKYVTHIILKFSF
jgi:hypothetical protein